MLLIGIFILFISLSHHTAFGIDVGKYLSEDSQIFQGSLTNLTTEENFNTSSENSSIDANFTEFRNDSLLEEINNTTFTEGDQINTTLNTKLLTEASVQSSDNESSSPSIHTSTSTSTSNNESHSPSSSSAKLTSTVVMARTTSSTATEDDEPEGVARGKPNITEIVMNATTVKPETIYQKALKLINDTYTLSILLPISAGIVFATTILLTVAMCRCIQRRCRRRRLRRKVLPDSVKNLRPSDRARLLAESSDEEF